MSDIKVSSVSRGPIGPTGPAGSADFPGNNFVFRPGGVAEDNVYTDWATLVAALADVQGWKSIQFDDSIVSPCVIPPGSWDMTDVVLEDFFHPVGTSLTFNVQVTISDGASLPNLRKLSGHLAITNENNVTAPVVITMPASDTTALFSVGVSSLADQPFITNAGTAAFWDISSLLAGQQLIIRGNAILGGSSPAIEFGNSPCTLALTLFEFRFASGMIAGSNPAAFVNTFLGFAEFTRQPNFAGTIRRGQGNQDPGAALPRVGATPLVRTLMFPAPGAGQTHAPASTVALTAATGAGMNTTYRLDCSSGSIAQVLPQIRAAAPPINSGAGVSGALNSEGCIVVIREFSGDNGVSCTPFAGETIEGGAGPYVVPAGGCRIFQSDGVSDWRIIAGYL